MTRVEIPTYGVVVENEYYARKVDGLMSEKGKKQPTTQLMRVARFTAPTEDDVINYLVCGAKELQSKPKNTRKSKRTEEEDVKTLLGLLPSSLLEQIAKEDGEILTHIRQHYNTDAKGDLQPTRSYLEVVTCQVPDINLEEAKKLEKKKGREIYGMLMENLGFSSWHLTIRLLENCGLPEESELEYLIERGVRFSDVFLTRGKIDYSNIAEKLRLIYRSLDAKKVQNFADRSKIFVDTKFVLTIKGFTKCEMTKKAINNIPEMLRDFFRQQGIGTEGE